jgi:RNA polymerase sigma-70 factor, ECF subfamily
LSIARAAGTDSGLHWPHTVWRAGAGSVLPPVPEPVQHQRAGMDQHLVERARAGDTGAFESLVVANHHRLFRVAHGILRDPHLAEDATQQAFLDIWRDLRRLRDPARFAAWSYRLLVRVCHAEAKRRPDWVPDTEISPDREPVASDVYRTVADRDQLERGFRHLSVDQRSVIVLHHLLDMTLDKVAETLDIPLGTAHSRLSRAMQALRSAMGRENPHRAGVPTERAREQVVR